MASSSWFHVEAKSFEFVCVEAVSVLRVYERSRGLVQPMGKVTMSWLLDTMTAIFQAQSSKEFVESLTVGVKAFIAKRRSIRFSCFVAVVEYGSGGRRGFVIFMEGRGGRGWSGFALELRRFLEAFQLPYDGGKGPSTPVTC